MSSFSHDERRGAFFGFRPHATASHTGESTARGTAMAPLGSPVTVATHDVEAAARLEGEGIAAIPESPESIPESLRIPILFAPVDERSHREEDEMNEDVLTGREERHTTVRDAGTEGDASASSALPTLLPRPASPVPAQLLLPPSDSCEEEAYDDDRTATSTCDETASTFRSPSPLSRHRRCESAHRHDIVGRRWGDRGVSGAGAAAELSSALASCWRGITFRGCCHPLSPLGSRGIEDDENDEREDNETAFVRRMAAAVRHKRKFDAFVPISEEEGSGSAGRVESDSGVAETSSSAAPSPDSPLLLVAPSPPSPPREREPLQPRTNGERQAPPQIKLQYRPSAHRLYGEIGPLIPMYESNDNGHELLTQEENIPYPEELVLPSFVGS